MTPTPPMDCAQVAERLYEYLDGELTAEVASVVRAHLESCARCFALQDFERNYLRFLEARARARGAPTDLKRRILDHLLFDGPEPESR